MVCCQRTVGATVFMLKQRLNPRDAARRGVWPFESDDGEEVAVYPSVSRYLLRALLPSFVTGCP